MPCSRRSIQPHAARMVIGAAIVTIATLLPHRAVAQQSDPSTAGKAVRKFSTEWNFREVDVARLTQQLRAIGISIPAELRGKISGGLSVEVPWASWRDARAWRIRGELTSRKLEIETLTVQDLSVVMEYRNGVLYLDQLKFRMPDDAKRPGVAEANAAGIVTGKARMELVPQGKFTATLDVEALPIAGLCAVFKELPPAAGLLSGSLKAEADVDRLFDLTAWTVAGPVTLDRFTLNDSPPVEADVQLTLSKGLVTASDFRLHVDKTRVAGRGTLNLLGKQEWNSETTVDAEDLRALLELVSLFFDASELQQAAGAVNGSLQATAKLSGTLSPISHQASGRAVLRNLRVRLSETFVARFPIKPVDVERLAFDYAFRDEELSLANLDATVADGRVQGDAIASFGKSELQADLSWSDVRPDQLLTGPLGSRGTSAGRVELTIPFANVMEPSRWSIASNLTVTELNVGGWTLTNLRAKEIRLVDGKLLIPQLTADVDDEPLSLALTVGIEPPWPVDAQFDLPKIQLAALTTLPQLSMLKGRLSGRATLNGQARGQLDPLAFTGTGSAEIRPLAFDEHKIDRIRFDYELVQQSLRLSEIVAAAYGGKMTGAAEVPLTLQTGAAANLQWESIDVGKLLGELVERPFAMQGKSNGRLEISVPVSKLERPEAWDITAAAEIPKLSLQDLELASVEAEAKQKDGRLEYGATGRLFEGALEARGQRDAETTDDRLWSFGSGSLTLQEADVAKLARLWLPRWGERIRATVDLKSSWISTPEGLAWNADAGIEEVSVQNSIVAQGLAVRLRGLDTRIRLDELTGSLAGGRLSVSAAANASRTQPIDFRVDLRRASAKQLLQLSPLESNIPLQGSLNLSLRGEVGRTWRMRGMAASENGRYDDFRFASARFPITLDWNPESGHALLQLTSGRVSLGAGKVTGKLTVRRTNGLTIDGDYRFYNVALQSLMPRGVRTSRLAKGRMTGSLSVSGRNVQSIDDVRAILVADLKDAQPMSMPVLSQIPSFVPGVRAGAATRFREGRIEARLNRGVVHLSRLSLALPDLQIYLTGNINLSGRLDLDAIVSTGRATDPVPAELLLNRLIVATSAPIGVLILANDYLANRVVHLVIRGTIRQPAIQVKPFESLGEEAVRFFLRHSTGGVSP